MDKIGAYRRLFSVEVGEQSLFAELSAMERITTIGDVGRKGYPADMVTCHLGSDAVICLSCIFG